MDNRNIKKMLILSFLLCVVPFHAQCRQYKIATVAWIGWSPLQVASVKGFWDESGLDVRVITYDDPIIILEAMKAKRIDFAMDMAGSLVGVYMNGEEIVTMAETNWSHGGDKIIVRKGDRLENHKNGTIGVFLHKPSCLFFLDQYLQQINLRLSDFRIVEINSRDLGAQFIAGRLPAIVNYEPWATDAVINGNGLVLATSADFKGCIPECLWSYRKFINNIPDEDILNIIRGWIKAVRWMNHPANQKEYFSILRSHTFKDETGLTDDDFSRMLSEVAIHGITELNERNQDDGGLFQFLASLKSTLSRNNMLAKDFTPEIIFDNRYIKQVLKEYETVAGE